LLRLRAKRFQFGDGGSVFDEPLWAAVGCQLEQPRRFVLSATLRRKFAGVEIGLRFVSVNQIRILLGLIHIINVLT
jgi:hypothetical protein